MNNEQNSPLAKLVWSDPQTDAAREFALPTGGRATIGRSAANDVHIPERRISRRHAVVNCEDGRFSINDLGSTNGTAVNSQPLLEDQAHLLQDGDAIVFGVTEARFRLVNSLAQQDEEGQA